MDGVSAAGDAVFSGPQHRVIVVGVGGDVHEEVQHGVVLHKGDIDIHLACGLGEAVGAVAVIDDFHSIAVLVRDKDLLHRIASIGRGRDGDGDALPGGLGTDGHAAVFGLSHRGRIGGCRGTTAGRCGAGGHAQFSADRRSKVIICFSVPCHEVVCRTRRQVGELRTVLPSCTAVHAVLRLGTIGVVRNLLQLHGVVGLALDRGHVGRGLCRLRDGEVPRGESGCVVVAGCHRNADGVAACVGGGALGIGRILCVLHLVFHGHGAGVVGSVFPVHGDRLAIIHLVGIIYAHSADGFNPGCDGQRQVWHGECVIFHGHGAV